MKFFKFQKSLRNLGDFETEENQTWIEELKATIYERGLIIVARFAEFKGDSLLWKPWLSVNVQIDADRVYPVFAFGRVFVFWAKIETELEDASNTAIVSTETDENTQEVSSNSQANYCLKIYDSFDNLNQEWVSPQQLT